MEKDLRKANQKITILEEYLKSGNEAEKRSDAKYEEAVLQEKLLLMRQKHHASSIALKIQTDDKETRCLQGYPLMVFLLCL